MIDEFQGKLSTWLTYWEFHNEKQPIPIEVIATDYWYKLSIRPNLKPDSNDPRHYAVMGGVDDYGVELISNVPTPADDCEMEDMIFGLRVWMIQKGGKN